MIDDLLTNLNHIGDGHILATKEELKQPLLEDLLRLIGDNENSVTNNGHDCYEKNCEYCLNGIRDELREELRQSITKYINGELK